MTKVQENAEAALHIVRDVDNIVQSLDWNSSALDGAIGSTNDLLYLANTRNNEDVDGIDWDLNAMIDCTTNSNSNKHDYLTNMRKIEQYLKSEIKD